MTVSNPLLHFTGLPKFNEIKPEHVSPAIEQLIAEGRALVEQLAASTESPTWENFARKLEDHSEKLNRAWSQVGHMNAVVNSPELREAYNDNLAKLTDYGSDISQDERLYAKYKAIQASPAFANLTPTQQQIINNEVRDFKLGGAELPDEQKARFKVVSEELSKLGSKFEENIMDNTNDFKHLVTDKADLAGIPDDAIQAAQSRQSRWQSGLSIYPALPVLHARVAIRRQSRIARNPLPRLRHTRLRVWQT
jgi:oligopeptidase A